MINEQQRKAVEHCKGAAMILAGPGTGKTFTITERIVRLVKNGDALEEELLVVTFTKAAAMEMQQRYEKRSETTHCKITFGTFHSVFFRILRESGPGFKGLTILKEEEKNKIIKEIVLRLGVEHNDLNDFIKIIISEISNVKGKNIEYGSFVSGVCDKESFKKIYLEYEKALRIEKKIDFDDMVIKCHKLLKEEKEVHKYWQNKFKYILIDEFQDINKMQYETIKLLVGEEENIFIVGDDDQAIYGFRGADNQIMFDFKKEYKNVKVINLNINYRSTKEIVDSAFRLIRHNQKRFAKDIRSNNGVGKSVSVIEFKNNILQYKYLAKQVSDYIKKGMSPGEIAILVRNNSTIPIIRNFLSEYNVRITAKIKNNIYVSNIAKDLLSYIKCSKSNLNEALMNNTDFINIVNKPYRDIGRHIIAENVDGINELINVYKNSYKIRENINSLKFHLEMIRRLDPYSAINYINYGIGYEEYLKEYGINNNKQFKELKQVFDAIWNESVNYTSLDSWINYVERQMNVQSFINTEDGQVNVLTMHASKGLEFKTVFIPDANQGVIPEMRAMRDYNVDEERRLFFVAMTRAVEELNIYYYENVMGRKCEKSQFIEEIS